MRRVRKAVRFLLGKLEALALIRDFDFDLVGAIAGGDVQYWHWQERADHGEAVLPLAQLLAILETPGEFERLAAGETLQFPLDPGDLLFDALTPLYADVLTAAYGLAEEALGREGRLADCQTAAQEAMGAGRSFDELRGELSEQLRLPGEVAFELLLRRGRMGDAFAQWREVNGLPAVDTGTVAFHRSVTGLDDDEGPLTVRIHLGHTRRLAGSDARLLTEADESSMLEDDYA